MELLFLGIFLSIIAGFVSTMVYKDIEMGILIGSYSMIVVIILLNVIYHNQQKQIPRDCQEIELKLKGER